jgi:murein DD-endopeptidase MepM/ murein hydrolase activator NlpD
MAEEVIKENLDLKRYYYKVQLLEQNLIQAREVVTRMTELAGIEYEFPQLPDDSMLFARIDPEQTSTVTRPLNLDWTLPAGLPIEGFVTQGFETEDPDHYHPGIDIACAIGTPVLATGSGIVEYIDYDSIYGHRVVVRHNDSVSSIYAHNDTILVPVGQEVMVGSRLALSGNSGKSSAPHLHYEIRVYGKPIDPRDNPYDKENKH